MQTKILKGLEWLSKSDGYLLAVDINERTLTHRLGMYYQVIFSRWDVDCEYNKYMNKPKDVDFNPRDLLARMSDILREREYRVARDVMGNFTKRATVNDELLYLAQQLNDPELEYDSEEELWFFILRLLDGTRLRKTIIPDIIVHKRGQKNNYIAIEAKKMPSPNAPSIASRTYDLLKLQALIQDKKYNYKQGYFILLPVSGVYAAHTGYDCTVDKYEPHIKIVTPLIL